MAALKIGCRALSDVAVPMSTRRQIGIAKGDFQADNITHATNLAEAARRFHVSGLPILLVG